MLTTRLDVTYTLVWSVAIANIIGAGICFIFADQLAKIAVVRIGILAPVIIAITFVGAFQGAKEWGDLFVLLGLGVLGWIMKRLRWLHTTHHDPVLMQRYNFNITYPIGDWVFGTLYRRGDQS